jgi:hypothetical protein
LPRGTEHYAGKAVDVNDRRGSEMAGLDALDAKLKPLERRRYVKDVLWRTAGHYNHLHVSVP